MGQSTTDETAVTESSTFGEARQNWVLIVSFSVLAVIGVVLSTGLLDLGVVEPGHGASVAVPMYVYLYSSFGALGYIFTKLMAHLDSYDDTSEIDRLVELALRIPVSWVLGAGTYLLSTFLFQGSPPNEPRFIAGVAFLVGLYVNVTMKSLGSLADRLLGRGGRS